MNLLDFKYWISLNESQKTYYSFEIPGRHLTELDEEYMNALTTLMSFFPESMYSISTSSQGSIELTLHPVQNELLSSIYGDSKELKIYLISPGSSDYSYGRYANISNKIVVERLSSIHHSKKIIDRKESKIIRFTLLPNELTGILTAATNRITPNGDDPPTIDASDFLDLLYDESTNIEKKQQEFTNNLNQYLRYSAVKESLKRFMVSEVTPNIEEISADIKGKREKVKSIRFSSLQDTEKSEKLREVLAFQKDLLSKSSTQDIESNLTADSLIDNFRILLKEVGGVKEIKKALDQVTD
jgi:hypothetical protein